MPPSKQAPVALHYDDIHDTLINIDYQRTTILAMMLGSVADKSGAWRGIDSSILVGSYVTELVYPIHYQSLFGIPWPSSMHTCSLCSSIPSLRRVIGVYSMSLAAHSSGSGITKTTCVLENPAPELSFKLAHIPSSFVFVSDTP